MHQYGMFLPLSPLCIPVFIVCQTQCSTPVHHVCISVTSRFFQIFHTPLFWRSGIAARFCCPTSNPAVTNCLYLFIGVVTSFTINTNFAVWILGMHFYWDRGSMLLVKFCFHFTLNFIDSIKMERLKSKKKKQKADSNPTQACWDVRSLNHYAIA